MTIVDLLSSSMPLLLSAVFILGLIIGSFLNVLIYRLPMMMQEDWRQQCAALLEVEKPLSLHPNHARFDLIKPDSHCPHCNHKLSALENIPLLSYLVLRGKCSQCKTSISLRYPLIELATGLLSCLIAYYFGLSWLTLCLLILCWGLIALTMIDIDHQLLPDDIVLPLLWLGLIVNSFGLITPLQNALWGAVSGYLLLWSIYWAFKLLRGKEGMGYGDFKLLAALGAWLGWQALPLIILFSSLVGSVVGILLILIQGRDKNIPIPFGPYLAGAGLITLFWGDKIMQHFLPAVT